MTNDEEKAVIERARTGDARAIRTLVDTYAPVVYRFSYNVCRNRDRAEHTTQETFLSVLRKLDQFDNRSKFSTWLYTIVSNHCLMLARSAKSQRTVSLDDDESPVSEAALGTSESDPHSELERSDLRGRLDDAIARLAPDYRMIFILRDIEGLSTEEVTQITGLSIAAVKSRLHRARQFLRTELSSLMEEEA